MFSGKNVIITGGSSGIGKGLAQRLARQGARIALVARDLARLSSARDEIVASARDSGARVEVFSCDATSFEDVEKTVAAVADKTGPPDCLINSAGILSAQYFEDVPLSVFHETMNTNFFGTLHFIKATLPLFKQNRTGRIINISSVAGITGVFGYSAYCSSKYAVVGLTEALRIELKPQGIPVHLVVPPEVKTPMLEAVNKDRPVENKKLAATLGVITIEETVEAVIRGVAKNRFLIIPGGTASSLMRSSRLFPGIARRVIDYRVKSCYRGPEA